MGVHCVYSLCRILPTIFRRWQFLFLIFLIEYSASAVGEMRKKFVHLQYVRNMSIMPNAWFVYYFLFIDSSRSCINGHVLVVNIDSETR